MPATATVSTWRNRAVDRAVPVAAMGRSYNLAVRSYTWQQSQKT